VWNKLPLFLCILFAIQSFVIYDTDFYSEFYTWFDYFDTVIYLLIIYDIVIKIYKNIKYDEKFKYNENKIICCSVLFLLLVLNLLSYQFEITDYINIYKSILVGGFIAIILSYIK